MLPLQDQLKPIIDLYSKGEVQEALDSIEALKKNYPNEPLIFNINGACFAGLGQLDSAIKCYKKAISISPNYADAHNNLGNTLKRVGELGKAVISLDKALDINPNHLDANYNLGSTLRELGKFKASIQNYQKVINIKPNHFEAHFFIGVSYKKIKKIDLAIIHFEKTIILNPDYAPAYLNLGNIFGQINQSNKAIEYYKKALIIKPDYSQASHMINVLNGNKSTDSSKAYVKNLFDSYAETFNESLVEKLEYKLPFIIRELILNLDINKSKFNKVIDLGCGTGLSGNGLRDISENLTGIDISKNMIDKTRELGVYDNLIVGDIDETLKLSKEKYDLFVALDVFVYVGELKTIFKTIRDCCNKNAFFIFSTEIQTDGGYSLLKSARFSHSEEYISKIALNGFKLIKSHDVNLRKDKKGWINGRLYIFQAY